MIPTAVNRWYSPLVCGWEPMAAPGRLPRGSKKKNMYAIAAIGLGMMILSVVMIVSPSAWSRGILAFSEKSYFHIFEIASRLLLGGVLWLFAGRTSYPIFFTVMAAMFVFAGVFLIFMGVERHRAFAVRAASYTRLFRSAGFASLAFGAFVVFAAFC